MALDQADLENSKRINNEAAMLHVTGEAEDAQDRYRQALDVNPQNASALNNLGFLLAQKGDLDTAIDCYEQALALDPENTTCLGNLASAQAVKGDVAAGMALLDQATALAPDDTLIWDNLGKLALAAGALERSEKAFQRAFDISRDAAHLGRLATVVAARGRLAEAGTLLQAATAAMPGDADLWRQLGVVCFVRQDFGSAQDALDTAFRLNPEDPEILRHLYLTELARGNRVGAEATLTRLIKLCPQAVGPQTDLAILRLEQGAFEAAVQILERALTMDDAGPRTAFYHGLALVLSGDHTHGRAALNEVASEGGKYADKALQHLQDLDAA